MTESTPDPLVDTGQVPAAQGSEAGGPTEPVLTLQGSAARALADLLELLGEVPSTPELLAHVSAARAADVSRLLPVGSGLGGAPAHGSIDVSASSLASIAGLLQRFGELASTPPVVAEDARSWASRLWERLEEDPPPGFSAEAGGHHPSHGRRSPT